MLSPEKSALLKSLLENLPAQAAMKLAKAVEVDRLAGGRVLPHEMILGALRPMLRANEQAVRTPTPQLNAQITAVTINPWWNVPQSIIQSQGGRFGAGYEVTRGAARTKRESAPVIGALLFWITGCPCFALAIAFTTLPAKEGCRSPKKLIPRPSSRMDINTETLDGFATRS